MASQPTSENITLYYRQGSSDKVYQTGIEQSGDGYLVNFAFGRRGSTLTTGTKTAKPVSLEQAKKIYDKLVSEKTAKGYTPGEAGTPYQHTDKADRATGIIPQLLNPIDEDEASVYIASEEWWAQEKFDGRRVMIRRAGDKITGSNRQGLLIDVSEQLAGHARTIGGDQWLLDGEAIGDAFYAFDLLECDDADLRAKPYRERFDALSKIVGASRAAPIRGVETAMTTPAKQAMLNRLGDQKLAKASSLNGIKPPTRRRAEACQHRAWIKLNFTATASCIVAGVTRNKRSVALELFDGQSRVGVGNVTIPSNFDIPAAGAIVEIRYLYAYPGGSLYQPVYLGVRG